MYVQTCIHNVDQVLLREQTLVRELETTVHYVCIYVKILALISQVMNNELQTSIL